MFDSLQEIMAHLRRNKLRTALTGLSVSVGIFLLIFLLGAGNGLIHAFEHNSGNFALDVVNVWPGTTEKAFDGLEKGRQVKFDNRDIGLMRRAFPDRVTDALGEISQSGVVITYGNKTLSGTLTGYYPDNRDINKVTLLYGRYLNDIDITERRKSLVLGEKSARELFGVAKNAVGKAVKTDASVFRVVGVYSDKGQMGGMEGHVPFTTLQTIYNRGTDVPKLTMRTRDVDTRESDSLFRADLRYVLGKQHRFATDDESALWIRNATTGAQEHNKAMGILTNALWVIGLLTLLSGVVGISNIMLITVKERTREFGIRKALGARPWQILRSVLLESVIITAFFGYLGLVAGVAATEYLNIVAGTQSITVVEDMQMHVFLNPTVDLRIALQALGVLIIAGLAAGFFPARKAVKVKPVTALNAK